MHVGQATTVYTTKDPTEAYTFSDWIDLGQHAYVDVELLFAGADPTSYEFKWQTSQDGSTPSDPDVEDTLAGAVDSRPGVHTLRDNDGTPATGRHTKSWIRKGSRYVRFGVKRTDGDATQRITGTASLGN